MVYLDHAATTPLRPEAREAMLPFLGERFGNPSGLYAEGREAQRALDAARDTVAERLNARPSEVLFTSGGTEAINTAMLGIAYAMRRAGAGAHVITTAIEHHAGIHAAQHLEELGFETTTLGCDGAGRVSVDEFARALRPDTVLASVMLANNEVGTIQPVAEVAAILREYAARQRHRVMLHSDAVQAPGWMTVDAQALGVDALSLSAHKFGGPKGSGVLFLRRATPFRPLLLGGGQEMQKRAGTENVAGAFGLAVAMELAWAERGQRVAHCRRLRDRLLFELPERVPDTVVTGPADPDARLPNNFSCCFRDVEGESVLLALDMAEIAASSGSACTTGALEPSHVLTAMGVDADLAHASLRLSVGTGNTDAQIDYVLEQLPPIVERLRALAPGA